MAKNNMIIFCWIFLNGENNDEIISDDIIKLKHERENHHNTKLYIRLKGLINN